MRPGGHVEDYFPEEMEMDRFHPYDFQISDEMVSELEEEQPASNRPSRLPDSCKKYAKKAVPLFQWLSEYSGMDALADFISGVTIGLIIIPQSVAYISLVGLSPKVGLASAVIGNFFYFFLGTIKEISIGPTAMMSLLTNEYTKGLSLDNIGLLTFSCGVFGLFLSIFKLGIIVEFISTPVSSAFSSAVALTILASELRGLLGLSSAYRSGNFFDSIVKFGQNCEHVKIGDAALGVACICILYLLDLLRCVEIPRRFRYRLAAKKILWLISMSRNAITILLACFLTHYFQAYHGHAPYKLTDPVSPGLPDFKFPIFDTVGGGVGGGTPLTILDKLKKIGVGIAIIPIVSLLVHVSIAKSFGSGTSVGVGHELFSLSLCNFLCSMFNASPVAGAFTRSAVSIACEVKTPIANIYTMIMAVLALTLLTPYFRLIPTASLSAVIVTAVVCIIDIEIVRTFHKASTRDSVVWAITLLSSLALGVEYGLIIGVLTNLTYLLKKWVRPAIDFRRRRGPYGKVLVVTPDLGLFFPAVDYLHKRIMKHVKNDQHRPVAVNCHFFTNFDYTAIKGVSRIVQDVKKMGANIVFFNMSAKMMEKCKILDETLCDYIRGDSRYDTALFEIDTEVSVLLNRDCRLTPLDRGPFHTELRTICQPKYKIGNGSLRRYSETLEPLVSNGNALKVTIDGKLRKSNGEKIENHVKIQDGEIKKDEENDNRRNA